MAAPQRHDTPTPDPLATPTADQPGPPSLRWLIPFAIPLGLIVYSSSFPGMAYLATLAAGLLLVGIGIAWFVRFLRWWDTDEGRRVTVGWVAVPVAVAAVVGLAYLRVPLQLRFDRDRAAFDEAAALAESDASGRTVCGDGGSVGSYTIERICRTRDVVVFFDSQGFGLDAAGFVLLPSGPDMLDDVEHLNPDNLQGDLGGGWHRFTAAG